MKLWQKALLIPFLYLAMAWWFVWLAVFFFFAYPATILVKKYGSHLNQGNNGPTMSMPSGGFSIN
jgi:hypothetical protein